MDSGLLLQLSDLHAKHQNDERDKTEDHDKSVLFQRGRPLFNGANSTGPAHRDALRYQTMISCASCPASQMV